MRIGGNSSSRILEGKNLRLASRAEGKTGSERQLVGSSHGALEDQEKIVNSKLSILKDLRKTTWAAFNVHLCRMYPHIHSQFSLVDNEGFVLTGSLDPFELWTSGRGENLKQLLQPLESFNKILWTANKNVYRIALADRKALLDHWVQEIQQKVISEAFDEIQEDSRVRKQLMDVYDEVDRRVLTTADVIGVTTTGLAKRILVLRHIKAQVVICEEAGEVLEAHMLSALIPSVQHNSNWRPSKATTPNQ